MNRPHGDRRVTLQRQAGARRLAGLTRRHRSADDGTPYPAEGDREDDTLVERAVAEESGPLAEMRETNLQHEATIRRLEEQLAEATTARVAEQELAKATDERRKALEDKMHAERKGFAAASLLHKKEVHKWKRLSEKLQLRCQRVEGELKSRRDGDGTKDIACPSYLGSDISNKSDASADSRVTSNTQTEGANPTQAQASAEKLLPPANKFAKEDHDTQQWTLESEPKNSEFVDANIQNEDMSSHVDELTAKLGSLLDENERLESKLTSLTVSEDRDSVLGRREERGPLGTLTEEALQLSSNMNLKMGQFVSALKASVRDYEGRLATAREELRRARRARDELSARLAALQEENDVLRRTLEEGEAWLEEGRRRREEIENARRDLQEAYDTCQVLQHEIDLLRGTPKKLSEG